MDQSGPGHQVDWKLTDGRWGWATVRRSFSIDFFEINGLQKSPSIPPHLEEELLSPPDRGQEPPQIYLMDDWADKARELCGWPWRCVSADYAFPTMGGMAEVTGGLRISDKTRGISAMNYGRVLPLTPRWGGLLLDLALFATASFALSTAFVALRQRRRRLRGLCTACGYPHPSNPEAPCPECGAPNHPKP